jgi:hypothetical protein
LEELYGQGKPEVGQKSDSIITLSEHSQFLPHRGYCAFGTKPSCLKKFRESIAIVSERYAEHMVHCVEKVYLILCLYMSNKSNICLQLVY